jgi:hypothetical protein
VKGKEPIPRERYKTWSIFLVTNQRWLIPENARRLQQLYERSQAFGRVVGADHLAVWFWKKDAPWIPGTLAENVDVERAINLVQKLDCQKVKCKPSCGPYLLFTTTYPDEAVGPAAYSLMQLGTSAEEIERSLDRIGDQLVTEGVIRSGASPQVASSDDFYSAWFGATRRALLGLGATFGLITKTPTLTMETGAKQCV